MKNVTGWSNVKTLFVQLSPTLTENNLCARIKLCLKCTAQTAEPEVLLRELDLGIHTK